MSHSHTPSDYSHVSAAARSLLAVVHNAIACCCAHLRLYRHCKQHLYQAIDLQPGSNCGGSVVGLLLSGGSARSVIMEYTY